MSNRHHLATPGAFRPTGDIGPTPIAGRVVAACPVVQVALPKPTRDTNDEQIPMVYGRDGAEVEYHPASTVVRCGGVDYALAGLGRPVTGGAPVKMPDGRYARIEGWREEALRLRKAVQAQQATTTPTPAPVVSPGSLCFCVRGGGEPHTVGAERCRFGSNGHWRVAHRVHYIGADDKHGEVDVDAVDEAEARTMAPAAIGETHTIIDVERL